MTTLRPPPEHEGEPYHFLRDTRVTASDGVPLIEPMLWHRSMWFRIGSPEPLSHSQHHHWQYEKPCRPDAIVPDARALAEKAAREWLHSYGVATEPYTRGGGDHPAMATLPDAFMSFAALARGDWK